MIQHPRCLRVTLTYRFVALNHVQDANAIALIIEMPRQPEFS
jgi:hypothetical protein